MFNKIPWLSKVAGFIPGLCMSFINFLVPEITKVITRFEKWDYASTLMQHQVWRNYLTKILNLAIFTIINIELASNSIFFREDPIIIFEVGTETYSCREDQASTNFIKLLITEFVVKAIAPLIVTFGRKLVC